MEQITLTYRASVLLCLERNTEYSTNGVPVDRYNSYIITIYLYTVKTVLRVPYEVRTLLGKAPSLLLRD